jgi:hypothetical protein
MSTEWWREVWSVGDGPSRTYCGIARTPEGFAVDVFEGDDCIESELFESRLEAAYAVDLFRRRYAGESRPAAMPVMADAR